MSRMMENVRFRGSLLKLNRRLSIKAGFRRLYNILLLLLLTYNNDFIIEMSMK